MGQNTEYSWRKSIFTIFSRKQGCANPTCPNFQEVFTINDAVPNRILYCTFSTMSVSVQAFFQMEMTKPLQCWCCRAGAFRSRALMVWSRSRSQLKKKIPRRLHFILGSTCLFSFKLLFNQPKAEVKKIICEFIKLITASNLFILLLVL